MKNTFQGKVVVVTGATSGIGRAAAGMEEFYLLPAGERLAHAEEECKTKHREGEKVKSQDIHASPSPSR